MISLIVTDIRGLNFHCLNDEVVEPGVDTYDTYKFCMTGDALKSLSALYMNLVKFGKNISNIPDDNLYYFFLKPIDSESGIIFKYYVTDAAGKALTNFNAEFINSFRIVD
jgi:hypothetical protein